MKKRKPTAKELTEFKVEILRLIKELNVDITGFSLDVCATMRESGVSENFDFKEMANSAFYDRLLSHTQQNRLLKNAKKYYN